MDGNINLFWLVLLRLNNHRVTAAMRTRTRDQQTLYSKPSTATIRTNYPSGPLRCETTSSTSNLFPYKIGDLQVTSDVVTPNFHSRSAKGEIFNNPFSSYKESREVVLSTKTHVVPYHSSMPLAQRACADHYYDSAPASPYGLNLVGEPLAHLPIDLGIARLRDLAGTSAHANVDAPIFEGAKFIAELRETISFLRNPFQGFNKILDGARETMLARRYLRKQSVFSYVSDNWLSYQLAIRPLVMDVQDAMKAINHVMHGKDPERRTARGSSSASGSRSSSGVVPGSSNLWEFSQNTNTEVSVRSGVLYELLRDPNTFGVGVPELPSAIWEATRFSFVVDYFFNIGTFLEAIAPVEGSKLLATWTTTKTTSTSTRNIWWQTPGTTLQNGKTVTRSILANGMSTETLRTTHINRSPGVSIGIAAKVSPLSGELGAKRIVNLIALTRQLLSVVKIN